MKLLEVEEQGEVNREQLAKQLHELADSLGRHNEVSFKRGGKQYRVKVPNTVELEVEIEIDDDGTSVEIEISW